MLNKKLIALSIILVSLLAVSAVSATENLTDNADDTTEVKVDDKLSDESNEILKFLNEVVLADYDNMEKLARNYEDDANFYGDVSNTMYMHSKELADSMGSINSAIEDIDATQESLSQAISDINSNLQQITLSSESVADETHSVLGGIETLQETIGKFNV